MASWSELAYGVSPTVDKIFKQISRILNIIQIIKILSINLNRGKMLILQQKSISELCSLA